MSLILAPAARIDSDSCSCLGLSRTTTVIVSAFRPLASATFLMLTSTGALMSIASLASAPTAILFT